MDLCARRAVILVFFLIVLSSTLSAYEISGRIVVEPPYPETKIVKVKKKVQDSCADEQISKSLLVSGQGGVANAVLWLEGNFETSKSLPSEVILDQTRCNFEPHVVLIPPGGVLKIKNSDPLAHDVRAFEDAAMLFRLDMNMNASPEERRFDQPGIYTLRCGLHPWMHAFAVQAAHSFYAVTDGEGRFYLKDIPSGKYMLKIWHETLGEEKTALEVTKDLQGWQYTFK